MQDEFTLFSSSEVKIFREFGKSVSVCKPFATGQNKRFNFSALTPNYV